VTRIKCTNGFVSWVCGSGHGDFAAGEVKPEFHVFSEFAHVDRQSLCHSTHSTQSTIEPQLITHWDTWELWMRVDMLTHWDRIARSTIGQ